MSTLEKDKEDLNKLESKTPHVGGNPGEDEFSKLIDKNFDSDEIARMEKSAGVGAKEDADSTRSEELEKAGLTEKVELLNSESPEGVRDFFKSGGKSKVTGRSKTRRNVLFGGLGLGAAIAALIATFSYTPLQLAHIKEVYSSAHGGSQETTLSRRKARIFNRAFFFREDGEFDGYKSRGSMFSFLENRKSTKILTELRSQGFKIEPETDPLNGRWTGKFNTILSPDGESISASNSSVWERRSALRSALDDAYPTRNFMWRSVQAHKLYSRFGINRTDWWTDNAATRAIDDAELKFRKKFRDALRRPPPLEVSGVPRVADANNDGVIDDADKALEAEKADLDARFSKLVSADILEAADDSLGGVTEESSVILENVTEVPPGVPLSASGKAALNAIKLTAPLEIACSGLKTLNAIESGSRTIKRYQLIKAFSVYLSLIDATRTGTVESKDVNAFMHLVTSADSVTGKTMYNSGGWQWASKGSGKEPVYGNTFNTGGGTTGKLAAFRTTATSVLGGPGAVNGTCKTVNNVFFQIGAGIAGIALAIGSGGTVTGGVIAASVALDFGRQMVLTFATPILTRMAAGTIVNGFEKGEKLGDMLSAASGSSFYAQGSNLGLRPLKKAEQKRLAAQYEEDKKYEIEGKPFYARLFDLSDTRSLASTTVLNSPRTLNDFADIITSPLNIFSGGKVSAQEEAYECNDQNIVDNDIATDPFCNPLLGEENLDRIDPIENMKWMLDNGYVNGEGVAQGQFAEYSKACFDNDNIETLFNVKEFTTTFTSRCMEDGVADLYLRFRAFRTDLGITKCIEQELDTGYCDAAGKASAQTPVSTLPGGTVDGSIGSNIVNGIQIDKSTTTMPNCPYTGPPGGVRGFQPGAQALQAYIDSRWGGGTGNGFSCRTVINGSVSNKVSIHGEGRAVDSFYNALDAAGQRQGNEVLGWLIANAQIIGIQYAKFYKLGWTPSRGLYCDDSAANISIHSNHIHYELNWPAALKTTPYFTGTAPTDTIVNINQDVCA